ncbi:ATP-binding protein [Rhizobium sp. C1]|uniref:ATP-binding protein n=1 Tax=Rhizobium sp. C1 TaxID=1349799 RepID=UPI001E59D10B|nr:ATP-binding protein [Rhizobium sp. C1]MCD2179789.1 ATP-binding protein [Rhizobium sp. C1]
MSTGGEKTSDILRRAGKRTALLQAFAAVLLVVLIYLYLDMADRQASLQNGIRESAMWAAFQLDREAHELEMETQLAVSAPATITPDRIKGIARRYDIVYSRADLLRQGHFLDFFIQPGDVGQISNEVRQMVHSLDPVYSALQKAPDPRSQLAQALPAAHELHEKTNNLLLAANTVIADNRAQARDELIRLQQTSGIYVLLLTASVGFLIFTLRRQLKAVRLAGLAFETMATDLASSYHAADAGNRAKSQFMATIGHEIRTPLNAILGTAELLQLSDIPDDVRASVDTISASGEALLEVLNEILDYSKIEYGKLEIETRPTNLVDLSKTVVNIMMSRARERGNTLVLDMPDQLERPWVNTDPTRLRQIILNLLSNATKFTSHGTVTLRLRESAAAGGLRLLRIEVQDTGIGIDEEGRKKLFKPFSQVDASISRRFGGTGLGLTICKEITGRLGGKIGVESEKGKGSTFWLEMAVEPADQPEIAQPVERRSSLAPLPGLKVLLVEDNKVNQQLASRFLERLGQTVELATNGEEAVVAAGQKPYHLILMDMQMPVMDGIEAARIIRENVGSNRATPIIAMTANASDEDRDACLEAGMDGFEPKPITFQRLHSILAGVAAERAAPISTPLETPPAPSAAEAPSLPEDGIDPARKAELVDVLGEEIFNELVASFFKDADLLLKDYAAARAAGDSETADKALHTLKGAAANVGFKAVAEIAQALRQTPQTQDRSGELAALLARYTFQKAA